MNPVARSSEKAVGPIRRTTRKRNLGWQLVRKWIIRKGDCRFGFSFRECAQVQEPHSHARSTLHVPRLSNGHIGPNARFHLHPTRALFIFRGERQQAASRPA